MTSPLNQVLDSYLAKPLSVIPIQPSKSGCTPKSPGYYDIWTKSWNGLKDWSKYADKIVSPLDIQQWRAWPDTNIGLPLGGVNQIVALDFDNDILGLHEKIESIAGVSPVKKKGAKGFTAFYKSSGEKNYKWSVEKQSVCELLSKGRQTVIPPSIHPSGEPYKWITDQTLLTINIDDLPSLPADFKHQVDLLIYGQEEERVLSTLDFSWQTPEKKDVLDALAYLDPSMDYEEWVHIGMAIQDLMGAEGFPIWDLWSSASAKYPKGGTAELLKKYNGFKTGTGITIKTLFKKARLNGYIKTYEEETPANIDITQEFAARIEAIKNGQLPVIAEPAPSVMIPTDVYMVENEFSDYAPVLNPPSQVLKDMVKWVEAVSIKPQRIYALSCSLTAMGMVLGNRIQSYTSARPNLFIVTLGESGTGKDRPMKAIDRLLSACELDQHLGGIPKSGPALLKAVKNANCRILYQIDEFGLYLSSLTNRGSATYQGEIIKNLMMLSTADIGMFRGDERADTENNPRIMLDSPHVCVNGVTTPSMFWSSLTSRHSVNGFLNRIILMESDHADVPSQIPADIFDIPEGLVSHISDFNAMPVNADSNPKGNIRALDVKPAIVHYTEKAIKVLQDFDRFCDKKRLEAIANNDDTKELWVRGALHAQKLALANYNFKDIDSETMEWACTLSRISINRMIARVADLVADNDVEASYKKIFKIIKDHGLNGINLSILAQKTQWIRASDRNMIVQDLINQGKVTAEKQDSLNSLGRPKQVLKAVFLKKPL